METFWAESVAQMSSKSAVVLITWLKESTHECVATSYLDDHIAQVSGRRSTAAEAILVDELTSQSKSIRRFQ